MHAVLLDRDTLDHHDLDFKKLEATLPEWHLHNMSSADQVAERIKGASVAVSNKVVLDGKLLAGASELKLIAIAATGTNNVDLEAAKQLGIAVCNVTGYATPSVVEHVFALILSLTRKLNDYRQSVAERAWQTSPHFTLLSHPIRELRGRTLGIIGYGELGHAVAKVAEAFGMQVVIAARPGGGDTRPGRVPIEKLLAECDIVTLHCPLSPETENLIGERELGLMKPDALLINAARGKIVDETALMAALQAGSIGGAAFDVLAEEPPGVESPLLLQQLPNLIVTPHIAWASVESRQRLIDEVALNIDAFINCGDERNRVA